MTDEEIKEKIVRTLARIAPEADLDEVDPGKNMREELDIDSYDFLNLLIGLNEELGVEIPEADYEKVATLTDLIRYLSRRLA